MFVEKDYSPTLRHFSNMSADESQMPPAELYRLVRALSETGQLSKMLEQIEKDQKLEKTAASSQSEGGNMSEACKRRSLSPAESMVSGFEIITQEQEITGTSHGYDSQQPVCPKVSKESYKYVLPPGVTSVEMWAETVCELPRADKLRYREIVTQAAVYPEMAGYLRWIMTSGNPSPKVIDLKEYLKAIGYQPTPKKKPESSGITYPGTDIIRKF